MIIFADVFFSKPRQLMRPLYIALLAILFLSNAYLLFHHFSHSRDIVYVDSSKLLNGYQGMLDARKAYQQKALVWQANIDTLVNEIQNDLKKFEKEMARMTVNVCGL